MVDAGELGQPDLILGAEVIRRYEVKLVRLFREVELCYDGCLVLHVLHEGLMLLMLVRTALHEDVVGLSDRGRHDCGRTRRQVSVVGRLGARG